MRILYFGGLFENTQIVLTWKIKKGRHWQLSCIFACKTISAFHTPSPVSCHAAEF